MMMKALHVPLRLLPFPRPRLPSPRHLWPRLLHRRFRLWSHIPRLRPRRHQQNVLLQHQPRHHQRHQLHRLLQQRHLCLPQLPRRPPRRLPLRQTVTIQPVKMTGLSVNFCLPSQSTNVLFIVRHPNEEQARRRPPLERPRPSSAARVPLLPAPVPSTVYVGPSSARAPASLCTSTSHVCTHARQMSHASLKTNSMSSSARYACVMRVVGRAPAVGAVIEPYVCAGRGGAHD